MRLLQEPRHHVFVMTEVGVQNLERDVTPDAGMTRLIDTAHAAAAELPDEPVMSEAIAGIQQMRCDLDAPRHPELAGREIPGSQTLPY